MYNNCVDLQTLRTLVRNNLKVGCYIFTYVSIVDTVLTWSDAAVTGFYSRVATIREWRLFRSANPFTDVEESEVA